MEQGLPLRPCLLQFSTARVAACSQPKVYLTPGRADRAKIGKNKGSRCTRGAKRNIACVGICVVSVSLPLCGTLLCIFPGLYPGRSRLGAGLAEPPITSSIPPSPTCPTAANVAALTAPTGAGGAAGGMAAAAVGLA